MANSLISTKSAPMRLALKFESCSHHIMLDMNSANPVSAGIARNVIIYLDRVTFYHYSPDGTFHQFELC